MNITQEKLLTYFEYKDGGLFWKVSLNRRIEINSPVGTLSKGAKYRTTKLNQNTHQIHRLIFLYHHGYLPEFIDHINGDKLDNRIENLRECSRSENHANTTISRRNTSGYKGIQLEKRTNKWVASITVNKKRYSLGTYLTKEEAAFAYNEAAVKHFGKFANLNELEGVKHD